MSTVTMTPAMEAVDLGINWLDANVDGWRQRVDLDTLALWNGDACILAQVYGTYYMEAVRRAIGQPSDTEEGERWGRTHGFVGQRLESDILVSNDELEAEWRRRLSAA